MARTLPTYVSPADFYAEALNRPIAYFEGTSATADIKFIDITSTNSATSGDSRGMYLKHSITGVGGGGDALRAYCVVDDVVGLTARGAHISLGFDTSGTITGLGSALTTTLHVPSTAGQTGTLCSINCEIWSDAATSDPVGATSISFIRFSLGGNTTGDDDVETDAVLFDLSGFTSGGVWTDTTSNAADEFIKVRTPSGVRYLVLSDSTTFA